MLKHAKLVYYIYNVYQNLSIFSEPDQWSLIYVPNLILFLILRNSIITIKNGKKKMLLRIVFKRLPNNSNSEAAMVSISKVKRI